jgi:beta-lactamase class A
MSIFKHIRWLQRARPAGSFAVAVAIGMTMGGAIAYAWLRASPAPVRALRESDIPSSSGYTFTDPLLGLAMSGNVATSDYNNLQQQVASYISQEKQSGLQVASVNFRDIEQSDGFTVSPDISYDPASLTKVPLMMAYYYLSETNPSILSDTITYSGATNLDAQEQIRSSTQLIPGARYTVDEMIDHMIRYSDNNAEQLLADHLASTGNLSILTNLFGDLGIKIDTNDTDNMTVQTYSLFLRVLFNATYLDRADSEKALRLLSETDFGSGIRAGVPSAVPVAEKFGDARIMNAANVQVGAELQDCGLVYYPEHTYILCVMTKGETIPHLEMVIAGISKIVYQDMQARYPASASSSR